ncbi:MAG: SAM-dependent methyltransferase [Burkholderiales bacterium]|jgi:16S rRNA (cytidine1402-2'-O)-methyltransferase|nr:SAM-dependent methyltransferase [Burkholderiales bacterium]
MTTGTLYLVPNLLGAIAPETVLPTQTLGVARRLTHWVVETPKPARAFLKTLELSCPIAELDIRPLPPLPSDAPHSAIESSEILAMQFSALLAPCLSGTDLGILTDAGCPGIADPGAPLVTLAHRCSIPVKPLVGPSSLLLALMASGMNGQRFTFHGYLPIPEDARAQALRRLEQESRQQQYAAQIFIETPYRNAALLTTMTRVLQPDSRLCVAVDLTLPGESVITRPVREWRTVDATSYQKRPAIFLLQS